MPPGSKKGVKGLSFALQLNTIDDGTECFSCDIMLLGGSGKVFFTFIALCQDLLDTVLFFTVHFYFSFQLVPTRRFCV